MHHQVPMLLILTAIVTRDFHMEYNAPLLTRSDDPTLHLTGNKREILLDIAPGPPMDEGNVQQAVTMMQPSISQPHYRQSGGGGGGSRSRLPLNGDAESVKIVHQSYNQRRKGQ